MKIERDAFLYLDGRNAKFAQCGSCIFGHDANCAIMGDRKVDPKIGSCGFYIHGLGMFKQDIADLDPEQTGYVERAVRCENCRYLDDDDGHCSLFRMLNEGFPEVFSLDTDVEQHGCCNAQIGV